MLVKAKGMGFVMPPHTEVLLRVAGRLAYFVNTWKVLTEDNWVLQTIMGFQVPFVGQPMQERKPRVPSFSSGQLTQMQEEISLLGKGAVMVVDSHSPQPEFYSVLVLVPKENGEMRPGPQPVGRDPSLQNGGPAYLTGPAKVGRLASKGRPEGCLPYSTHSSGTPTLPSVQC